MQALASVDKNARRHADNLTTEQPAGSIPLQRDAFRMSDLKDVRFNSVASPYLPKNALKEQTKYLSASTRARASLCANCHRTPAVKQRK